MPLPFAGLSLVVAGHVCRDLLQSGERIGGTATYAALTAHRLGATARVVTATGADLDLAAIFGEIAVSRSLSTRTTTFRNVYDGPRRRQQLLSWAGPVPVVPPEWRESAVVLLGPIAQEVPADWVGQFPHSLVGVSPQGWMREWDNDGHVRPCGWAEADSVLSQADAVFLSLDDVGGDEDLLHEYARRARLLVVTEGRRGVTVHRQGERCHIPAWPVDEVDPTGAGDVFAAAFLLHLVTQRDPVAAADFANCVASFAVERPGIEGIPTWDQVEERWNQHRAEPLKRSLCLRNPG